MQLCIMLFRFSELGVTSAIDFSALFHTMYV